MNFGYSDDQLAWRETVRAVLRRHAPVTAARELAEQGVGWSADTWRRLADIGAHGIHVTEELGGQGFGVEELAIVAEEAGTVLLRAPYTSNAVAASMLAAAGRSVTGAPVAAAILPEPGSGAGPGPATRPAAGPGAPTLRIQGGRVTGTASTVPFGAHVAAYLVAAGSGDDAVLALVAADAAGVRRSERASFDLTTPVGDVEFTGAPADVVATGADAERIAAEARLLTVVLAAAEMVGGMQACLDAAVGYARDRHQFGRPIGSFQAVKHLCAEMFVELELARSATMYAVWALGAGADDRHRAASTAKALASDAYLFVADTALHVHGGMGFTWEHDSHLYLRRATVAAAAHGDAAHHRELFLTTSGH